MPELPEVETICRYLRQGNGAQPAVEGKIIGKGQVLWERTVAEPSVDSFVPRIQNQAIQSIGRRGKYLLLHLSADILVIHLRMSGDLRVELCSEPLQAHDRFTLEFTDGWRLAFNDARKFGRVWLVTDVEQVVGSLGPEPLAEGFTEDEFVRRLSRSNRALKPLLLDQNFIAGLGNIYTDEALHLAGLHPLRRASGISPQQGNRLFGAIRQVLIAGITAHGASIDWVYRGGDFQNSFRVYRRSQLPCLTCGTPVQRIVVGQRGTHFCPVCQPMED